jgi:endonuclease/exonuclease/phosphatase family metal-dependent hydrolase
MGISNPESNQLISSKKSPSQSIGPYFDRVAWESRRQRADETGVAVVALHLSYADAQRRLYNAYLEFLK